MHKVSSTARAAHNLGLAAWFGGSLFGLVALNPSVSRISDKQERGRVLNESWARYNAISAVAIVSTLASWRLGGLKQNAELRTPALERAKNVLLGGATVSALAAGVLGARVAGDAPEGGPAGGTPVESGTEPGPETPPGAARAQRLIRFFGSGALTMLASVIVLSAVSDASRPKLRGGLSRLFSS